MEGVLSSIARQIDFNVIRRLQWQVTHPYYYQNGSITYAFEGTNEGKRQVCDICG